MLSESFALNYLSVLCRPCLCAFPRVDVWSTVSPRMNSLKSICRYNGRWMSVVHFDREGGREYVPGRERLC